MMNRNLMFSFNTKSGQVFNNPKWFESVFDLISDHNKSKIQMILLVFNDKNRNKHENE